MHATTTELTLRLPDLSSLASFSWIGCNPHYSPSNRESSEWMLSHGVFPDHKRCRLFATNPESLGAHVYPYADPECLRIATDMLTMLFTLDELTDFQRPEEAGVTRDTFVRALTNNFGNDTSPITMFTKDFMERLTGNPNGVRERFVRHFIEYMDATAREASLRASGDILSLDEYISIRRHNGGLLPAFDIVEVALGVTLPTEVLEDKNFQSIVLAANDLISFSNDVHSYAHEYSNNFGGFNSITVLMHSDGLSHQEAMDRVGELYKNTADVFVACKGSIRKFGSEIDEMVSAYVYGLEQWICGHNAWNLITHRFLGEGIEEVKYTGIVKLEKHTSSK